MPEYPALGKWVIRLANDDLELYIAELEARAEALGDELRACTEAEQAEIVALDA